MRRRLIFLLMTACMLLFLAGCGDPAVRTTTVEVKKNGHVVHTIVEDFAEDYYDLDGLKSTIEEACSVYNDAMGSGLVKLTDASVENGVLTAVMDYKSASAYAGFNRQALFLGTVQEASQAGYDLNRTFYSAREDGKTVGKAELLEQPDAHIVVIREAVDVRVWGKVLYYSEGASLQEDGTLTVTDGRTLTMVVFK